MDEWMNEWTDWWMGVYCRWENGWMEGIYKDG